MPLFLSQGRNPLRPPALDHELAGSAGQVARAALGYEEHVLEAHAAELREVDAGLHGDDVAGCERLRAGTPDRRHLVDLETHAVPGAMDEPARHSAVLRALLSRPQRVVTGLEDDVLDELMHLASRDAGAQGLDAGVLRALGDLVHLHDLGRRLTLRDGARHVRPIPRRLVL